MSAWGWTLSVALMSLVVALVVGSLIGILRTTPNKWFVGFSNAWTELFRNIPLLVQIFLWYHVIPSIFLSLRALPSIVLVVFALGFFTSARISEQVKAGIQALPKGQRYAGLAVGLTLTQTYRYVLLPMAFRIVIPPLTSESMNIVKNSSVAFAVSIAELTMFAMQAAFYVNTLRSIPLVMVILWFFLLIPLLIGRPMGAELSAIITFTIFEAAYYSEIMRAGIQSVPKGQVYAGYAVGMTYKQCMQLIVLPQAFRNMLPVLLTQTIILFQDTSLVYAIGAYDLLKGFEVAGKNFNRPVETYLTAAVVYFIICFTLSMLVRQLQKKIAIIR